MRRRAHQLHGAAGGMPRHAAPYRHALFLRTGGLRPLGHRFLRRREHDLRLRGLAARLLHGLTALRPKMPAVVLTENGD
jgi:hypothetical protein